MLKIVIPVTEEWNHMYQPSQYFPYTRRPFQRPYLVVAPPEVAARIRRLERDRQWSEAEALSSQYVAEVRAHHLIVTIRLGLDRLRGDPQRYQALDPENGWGNYEGLVRFTADYLAACEKHPDAMVRVSR